MFEKQINPKQCSKQIRNHFRKTNPKQNSNNFSKSIFVEKHFRKVFSKIEKRFEKSQKLPNIFEKSEKEINETISKVLS